MNREHHTDNDSGSGFRMLLAGLGFIALVWLISPLLSWRSVGEEKELTFVSWLLVTAIGYGYLWAAMKFIQNGWGASTQTQPTQASSRDQLVITNGGLPSLIEYIASHDLYLGVTGIEKDPKPIKNGGVAEYGSRRLHPKVIVLYKSPTETKVFDNVMRDLPPEAVTTNVEDVGTIVVVQGKKVNTESSLGSEKAIGWNDVFFMHPRPLRVYYAWRSWYEEEGWWDPRDQEYYVNSGRMGPEAVALFMKSTNGFPKDVYAPVLSQVDPTDSLTNAQSQLLNKLTKILKGAEDSLEFDVLDRVLDQLTSARGILDDLLLTEEEHTAVASRVIAANSNRVEVASKLFDLDCLDQIFPDQQVNKRDTHREKYTYSEQASRIHDAYFLLFFPEEYRDAKAGLPVFWDNGIPHTYEPW